MERVRKEGKPILVLNGGNLFFRREVIKPNKVIPSKIRADLILTSYNKMGCDALNIGAYDLSLGIDYLRKKEKTAKFPFISANIVDSHGKNVFVPYLMKTVDGIKVGIFGLCGNNRLKLKKIPGGNKIKVVDPMVKAEEISSLLRKKGADYVILLTTLTIRSCRRIAQREMPINLIIGCSKRNRISLPILVHDTYIVHVERGGKSIGRLDISFLGPAGLDALPAAVRFKGKTVGNLFLLNHFFPLRMDIPDHPEIGPLVKKVEARLTRLQQLKGTSVMAETGKPKPILQAGNHYVFAETCKECHPKRYEMWSKSPHARAYKALVEQEKYYDEDCIGCHTLAYGKPEGFSDVREVGDFANVQCESCHGPGYLHVKSEGKEKLDKDLAGGKLCLECHIEEKSPEFDLEIYFRQMCKKPLKMGGKQ